MLRRWMWLVLIPMVCMAQTGSIQLGINSAEQRHSWEGRFRSGYTRSKLDFAGEGKLFYGDMTLQYKKFLMGLTLRIGKLYGDDSKYNKDTDWYLDMLYYRGNFLTKSKLNEISFRIGYEILKRKNFKLYLFAQAMTYEIEHFMYSCKYYIIESKYFEYNVEGLASTYNSTNTGYGFGLEGIGRRIQFTAMFYPFVETRGEGNWNLRNLNFYHFLKSRALTGCFEYNIPVYKFISCYVAYNITFMWLHRDWKQDTVYIAGQWQDWGEPYLTKDTKIFHGLGGGLRIQIK